MGDAYLSQSKDPDDKLPRGHGSRSQSRRPDEAILPSTNEGGNLYCVPACLFRRSIRLICVNVDLDM